MHAEWSQVGTAHMGRLYSGGERQPLPPAAAELFARLREHGRDPERGVWLSARIDVPATGEPEFTANTGQRVYWNSDSLFTPPTEADPVPSDEQWVAELRRNPRAQEFMPEWLPDPAPANAGFSSLRSALDRLGLPRAAVRLPGETHTTFEGALLVRELESLYSVDLFDYGQLHHLGMESTDEAAGMRAWSYLSAPLPAPVHVPSAELAERAAAAQEGYRALTARIHAAGPGGVMTNLPPGVPLDRWGSFDGFYVFAWQTPLAHRSLPPSATADGARQVTFLVNQPVPVQAQFAPAWFDQEGGGIRFRTQVPLRALLRAGELSVVTTQP